jgi:ATP synthase protein I
MSAPRRFSEDERLETSVDRRVKRLTRAKNRRRTLVAQSAYLGSLWLVFVLPVVAGAYIGHWLDELLAGYSLHWTLSLILLGLVVGGVNVYLMVRK